MTASYHHVLYHFLTQTLVSGIQQSQYKVRKKKQGERKQNRHKGRKADTEHILVSTKMLKAHPLPGKR